MSEAEIFIEVSYDSYRQYKDVGHRISSAKFSNIHLD